MDSTCCLVLFVNRWTRSRNSLVPRGQGFPLFDSCERQHPVTRVATDKAALKVIPLTYGFLVTSQSEALQPLEYTDSHPSR